MDPRWPPRPRRAGRARPPSTARRRAAAADPFQRAALLLVEHAAGRGSKEAAARQQAATQRRSPTAMATSWRARPGTRRLARGRPRGSAVDGAPSPRRDLERWATQTMDPGAQRLPADASRARPRPGFVEDLGDLASVDPDSAPGRGQVDVVPRAGPRGATRPAATTSAMPGVALTAAPTAVGRPARARRSTPPGGDRGLAHRRLAERRQDLGDVAEEGRVRPDHQHTDLVEQPAVLVQEECGPVQPDRGLARAGPALDDQARLERRPDHLVLLGLDGGDDVAHLARCAPVRARRAADPGCRRGVRRARCRGRRRPRRRGLRSSCPSS